MDEQKTEAALKLQNLGQRLRDGMAMRHPVSEKALDAVRKAVREQFEDEEKERIKSDAPLPPAEWVPPPKEKRAKNSGRKKGG